MRHPALHLSAGLWAGLASVLLWSGPAAAEDYILQQGDTLMGIALTQLGSSAQWWNLCDIKQDWIKDCNLIVVGTRLPLSDRIILEAAETRARAATPDAAQLVAPCLRKTLCRARI